MGHGGHQHLCPQVRRRRRSDSDADSTRTPNSTSHPDAPTPTRTPTPELDSDRLSPTPGPPPVISTVSSPILVGASFNIIGSHFSAGAKVNFFVATSSGSGQCRPADAVFASRRAVLTVPVPATVPLGQGFVDVQVVNTDQGFKVSNLAPALLQGSAAAGIPSLTAINGVGLAADQQRSQLCHQ